MTETWNSGNNRDWETDVYYFKDRINNGIRKHKLHDSADCIDIVGISYLVADLLKWKCRYVADDRKWYWYADGYWKPDDFDIKIKEYVKIISNGLLDLYNSEFIKIRTRNTLESVEETIQKLSESEETKILLEWKEIALTLRDIESGNKVIKELLYINPLYFKDFNTSPHLLNCLNCTLNLKTKEVMPHNPELLLINTANAEYNRIIKCETWENFVNEMMRGNEENTRFLQKITGYLLTGDISYERFFIFQGRTNHKIIFMETILKMLENYAVTFEPEVLSTKNNGDVAGQLLRLTLARFVNVNEIPKETELNSSLINRIISGSTIAIKDKYRNTVEIKPQCKIGLTTNFLPKIADENIFESRKINKLKLYGNEQSKELMNSFQEPEKLSGILNRALKGLDLLNTEGLNTPVNAADDIKEYRGNIDIIDEFIQSCFIKADEHYKEQSSRVYEQYKFWCRHNEFYYDYPQKFWGEMVTRVRRTRSNKGYVIWGYKLISRYSRENPYGDDYGMPNKPKPPDNSGDEKQTAVNKGKIELLKNKAASQIPAKTAVNTQQERITDKTEKGANEDAADNIAESKPESSPFIDELMIQDDNCDPGLLDPFKPIDFSGF